MEPISQLDVQNPDHISVITRDGKVTISVTKDGASVTLGFPVRSTFNTTPRTPLEQPKPRMIAVKESQRSFPDALELGRRFKQKLNAGQVKELKQILNDEQIMSKFKSKTKAYEELGRIYGVSGARIAQIANGNGWNHVKP